MLFAIFGAYVSLMVESAKLTSLSEVKNPYSAEEAAIKSSMLQKSVAGIFRSLQPSKGDTLSKTSVKPDLSVLRKLELKNSDPQAERLLVAAREEYGLKQKQNVLEDLSRQGDPADRAFVAIYDFKTLSREKAAALKSQLPDDEFAYRLAKVHASDKAGDASAREYMSPQWKGYAFVIVVIGALGMAAIGVILWAIYLSFRTSGKWVPLGHPAEPISKGEADRFAYRAGVLMTAFMAIEFLLGALLRHSSIAIQTFGIFVVVLAVVFAIHKVPALGLQISLARIGVSRDRLKTNLVWGLAGYTAMIPVLLIFLMVGSILMKFFGPSSHPITEVIQAGPNPFTIVALYFGAAVAAPIWEEIMFRGTLLPAVAGALGRPIWGILISSFVFAAIHPQGVPLWLALGSIGAMNACLAYQTKSLIPCMVVHALNNAVVLTFALLIS